MRQRTSQGASQSSQQVASRYMSMHRCDTRRVPSLRTFPASAALSQGAGGSSSQEAVFRSLGGDSQDEVEELLEESPGDGYDNPICLD